MSARRWSPPLVWAAVILALSSIPNPDIAAPTGSDKVAHFAVYGVLGALLARAAASAGRPRVWSLARLAAGAALFGALDEWHQRFIPGRFASVDDWVADALGAAAGIIVFVVARPRRELRT